MTLTWLFAGAAVGVLNGLTLRWTVARLRPDMVLRSVALVVGGMFLRWGLAAVLLVAALLPDAVSGSSVPGLLAFAGLWLSRWGIIWWLSRAGSRSPIEIRS
jgi:hypothetical protein